MAEFKSLESIFQMMEPSDLMAAKTLSLGKNTKEISWIRTLLSLLLESGSGVLSNADLVEKINELRLGSSGQTKVDQKLFDRLINVYSTAGDIDDVTYPYMYQKNDNGKLTTDDSITVDQILGCQTSSALKTKRAGRDVSIIVSRTPFISPASRDANKVEIFLNFLSNIVISRCVPIVELEFVYDKGIDKSDDKLTASSGLLRFLMGGAEIKKGSIDATLYNSRTYKIDTDGGSSNRIVTGMEMFTSPQTLVNMNPLQPGSRYVDILDPTRPFASLESVTISVNSTVGIMSFKKATAVIKLHDRSRLAELADLIQPTTYTKSSVWLTYGWRHPYEPSGVADSQTYADFINNNMLVREAYGVKNAGFTFDAVGQVTITLELFTKSVSELRDAKTTDDEAGFKEITKQINSLVTDVKRLRQLYRLDPPEGINKEIRGQMILDAAESGTFPDVKEALENIEALKKTLKETGKACNPAVDPLIKALEKLYKKGSKGNTFDYKEQVEKTASNYVRSKFVELSKGPDPFLPFQEKCVKWKSEADLKVDHPLLGVISHYNSEDISKEVLKDGISKKVCSFGKLFCTFMAPALFSMDSIDEYQLLFYSFNDRCGPLSACSIAEFPIDVPVFLRQYKEVVEAQGTPTMTIESFIKLAVDAQINDIRAIGYGLRAKNIFKPWDPKGRDVAYKDGNKQKEFDSAISSINGSRGAFQMPQIEVYVEVSHVKQVGNLPVDKLAYYDKLPQNAAAKSGSGAARVLRIHIFDKTNNPYRAAGQLLRADNGSAANFYEVESDEWTKAHCGKAADTYINVQKLDASVQIQEMSSKGATGISVAGVELLSNTNNQKIKHLVSKMVPSLIYGMNTSAIIDASVQTKHDPLLTAAQLLGLNSGKKTQATPQGGGMGGLPLKVIPAQLSLRTIGCPLLNYMQLFFVDFNTGTTLDNIYGVTGITHSLAPGKFDTSLTMAFYDAYGRYEGAPQIAQFSKELKGLDK